MFEAVQSITRAISGDVERFAERSRRDAILVGFTVLFGLTAYGSGVAALAIYASQLYGPVWALLIISLAGVFAMLVVIAIQQQAKQRDRRAAAKAEARMRTVSTLGTALLPLLVKSKAGRTTAIVGVLAYVANELLKAGRSSAPRPQRAAPSPRHHMQPPHVNGAVNPYLKDHEQEYAR